MDIYVAHDLASVNNAAMDVSACTLLHSTKNSAQYSVAT